jgi:hypothetical protein
MAGFSIGFATLIEVREQIPAARLLIDSLQTFGGDLTSGPMWVFDLTHTIQNTDLVQEEITLIPLVVPERIRGYMFAAKVAACAQAEALADSKLQSLVWIDPECLIVHPPSGYRLGKDFDAAVRPVHIKNIGLEAKEPLNVYWERIYQLTGRKDSKMFVESFVDRRRLRAYFNSHAFAINPSLGIMQEWAKLFEILVIDEVFQQECCQTQLHRIFLFQALLSALLTSRLETKRIRILPETYNYPYNLHRDVPPDRRARTIISLATLVWEGRSLVPEQVDDIEIEEPLRTWLSDRDW